jgi:hypothetical protein
MDNLNSYTLKGFNAAVNILAVEYLIKTENKQEYGRRIDQLYALSFSDLECLTFELEFNMHIGNLGEMITQNDYDDQVVVLLKFLDT